METAFFYQIKDTCLGKVVVLGMKGPSGEVLRTAEIAPEYGFNLYRFYVDGESIIYGEEDEVKNTYFTETPIMYPTPNRVQDGLLLAEGKEYSFRKNGELRRIHGLVYDEQWEFATPIVTEKNVQVTGWTVFSENSEFFSSFPWESRLCVTWVLDDAGITFRYEMENHTDRILPYGIGIHTYFPIQAYDASAEVVVPSVCIYEADEERFPFFADCPWV